MFSLPIDVFTIIIIITVTSLTLVFSFRQMNLNLFKDTWLSIRIHTTQIPLTRGT